MKADAGTAVIASLAGDAAIAITKFVAAAVTGSSAMLAEAIHSVVDSADALLLLFGMRQSRKPPDPEHPFGHGPELYFWTFMVAVVIFGVGGGLSVYEGISHILHPEPIENLTWNYIVLGAAMVFQVVASTVAFRQFRRVIRGQGIFHAAHATKDPTIFAVVFEDAAAILGLVIAFVGITLSTRLEMPAIDGAASILIGLLLAAVAVFLAIESKGLLVGEGADRAMLAAIEQLAAEDPGVVHVTRPLTMYLGPDHVLLNLDIQFRSTLTAAEIATAVDRLERKLRLRFPVIKQIYIEARSLGGMREAGSGGPKARLREAGSGKRERPRG